MGKGLDSDRQEDSAARDEERSAVAHEAGSLVSPDSEYQLSADDCAERAADAGDDYSQLAGLYPDAADRSAVVYGEHDVGVNVLPGEPEGAISKTWYKTFLYVPFLMALGVGLTITNTKAVMEALFGVQSAFARTPKYSVKKKGEKVAGKGVSEAARNHSVDRTGDRMLLRVDGLVCGVDGELLYGAVSSAVCVWLLVYGAAEPVAGAV